MNRSSVWVYYENIINGILNVWLSVYTPSFNTYLKKVHTSRFNVIKKLAIEVPILTSQLQYKTNTNLFIVLFMVLGKFKTVIKIKSLLLLYF